MNQERYRINSPKVISETLEGESIILNYETGAYYSLNDAATEIWECISKEKPVSGIMDHLSSVYQTSGQDVQKAVESFIERLKTEALIVASQSSAASVPVTGTEKSSSPEKRVFEEPSFEKFTDMEDLLLLDPIHEVNEEGWPHAQPEGNKNV